MYAVWLLQNISTTYKCSLRHALEFTAPVEAESQVFPYSAEEAPLPRVHPSAYVSYGEEYERFSEQSDHQEDGTNDDGIAEFVELNPLMNNVPYSIQNSSLPVGSGL